MTKPQLINAICKLQGRWANRQYLKTLASAKLAEIHQRWTAISQVTEQECRLHCDVSFIK